MYVVGTRSVCGRYVVGMWSVRGREGGVVGKRSVRNCEWSVVLFIQQQAMKSRVVWET